MSSLSQVALFHQLDYMFVLCCLLKRKGKGSIFLCVDYCSLNAKTMADAWPLEHIDDLLSHLKGARAFSSLELWDGYQ